MDLQRKLLNDIWQLVFQSQTTQWGNFDGRYGSSKKIFESVIFRLKSLKHVSVKDPEVKNFKALVDTCCIPSSNILGNPELAILNLRLGIDIILNKLPEYINIRCRNYFLITQLNSRVKYFLHKEKYLLNLAK